MNVKRMNIIFHIEYVKITLDNILFDKKKNYAIQYIYNLNCGG